ncbi:MAG: DUF4234 domain-containing protein [Actinomycetota bacterium]|nr:DUF4234 domain-containing protein [Actinomycetota bacterium]
MTDHISPPSVPATDGPVVAPTAGSVAPAAVPPPFGVSPSPHASHVALGKIRGTGLCILLVFVTLGIYSIVWFYQTHAEMKRHSGNGLGGGLALVLAIFVGFVSPYISSSEVGQMYERAGQKKPVSGATGLWYFPGLLILVGPLVWFIKTNGALNAYWRSQGVR